MAAILSVLLVIASPRPRQYRASRHSPATDGAGQMLASGGEVAIFF
jgi:hypothetical protein